MSHSKCTTRRNFLKTIGLGSGALMIPGLYTTSAKSKLDKLPNIVYILADDLGYGDISSLNENSKINTPHIDRLAREGMSFTDAHSGSAVCTPTRYGILTGRYAWRSQLKAGVLWGYSPPLIEQERMTVASMLKTQGYTTACVGKWHLGLDYTLTDGRQISQKEKNEKVEVDYSQPIKGGPVDLGFDYSFIIPASLDMDPYIYVENDHAVAAPTDNTEGTTGYEFYRKGPIAPGFKHEEVLPKCTDKAVRFINKQSKANPEKPLLLYFPLNAPHTPILPTEEFKGKSGVGVYGDFVQQCDWTVGQIMKALEKNGRRENTLFIFTSDNGCSPMANFEALAEHGHQPSYRFRGHKADIFEGGHHIPFIASWPVKVSAGSHCDDTICLTDLMATAADICNVDLPDNAAEDSISILPDMLQTANSPVREATVHHSVNGDYSIRQGKWKLELCPGSGGWSYPVAQKAMALGLPMVQLYDLSKDIGEQENLQARYPDVVHQLTKLLDSYVNNGRSTPGMPQQNEGETDIWRAMRLRGDKNEITEIEHLAKNKKIEIINGAQIKYSQNKSDVMLDGIRATSWYNDGYWAGFEAQDFEAIIDLGSTINDGSVKIGFLEDQESWIFLPRQVNVFISENGKSFKKLKKEINNKVSPYAQKRIKDHKFKFESWKARFIKVKAKSIKKCPDWHTGAGGKAWMFIDEIIVQ